jgi:UPF0716 family protein affecting phage T7 exclusion
MVIIVMISCCVFIRALLVAGVFTSILARLQLLIPVTAEYLLELLWIHVFHYSKSYKHRIQV